MLTCISFLCQVCESSDGRSDTSITSDIDTDDGIRSPKWSNSKSYTISDTELDYAVAKLKRHKVYQKKKGQSWNFNNPKCLKMKGYLSPTVSGQNMTEIIECSNAIRSQHTKVEVVLQETCMIIKAKKPEEVSGKWCSNISNLLKLRHKSK